MKTKYGESKVSLVEYWSQLWVGSEGVVQCVYLNNYDSELAQSNTRQVGVSIKVTPNLRNISTCFIFIK